MSGSLPRLASFVSVFTNSRPDEFNQASHITMQFFGRQGVGHGLIYCGDYDQTDDGIWNPYAMFELEEASTGETGAVHIKSRYNQKYIRKASEDPTNFSLAAAADAPEEDTSKWSCTLFRLVHKPAAGTTGPNSVAGYEFYLNYSSQEKLVRGEFRNVHEIMRRQIWFVIEDRNPSISGVHFTRFLPIDMNLLPTMPTYVCFKADNDRYLRVEQNLRATFTGTDRRERAAQFMVVRTRLRSVALQPVAYPDTYLVTAPNANHYVASRNTSDWSRGLVEPVTLNFAGPAAVALRSLSNTNRFLVRRTNDNALEVSSQENGIVAQAEFLTEDTVRSRQLTNVQFFYDDMNILEPTPVAVLTKHVYNGSHVSTQEAHVAFRYSEYQSSHWETTHSWQVGVSWGSTTTVSARLPVLKFVRAEATVEVNVEAGYQGEHVSGETKEEESEMTTSFTLKVPPRTRSIVNMVVSRAKIQLPYSYTQREMLHDGTFVSTKKVDGLYEGEGTHVDYQVEEETI